MDEKDKPHSAEFSYLIDFRKHLHMLLQRQSSVGLTQDWSQFCYDSPRVDATYILYQLLFLIRKQLIKEDKYSVAAANLIIPLTKHLNAWRQNKNALPATLEDLNENIEQIRLKHLTNELTNSKKLIETLEQYKDLYLGAKIELKKLKKYHDAELNDPNSSRTNLAEFKQLQELTGDGMLDDSLDVYQKINSLLDNIKQSGSEGGDAKFDLCKELKALFIEVDQLEKTFRHQIPLIEQMADKLSNYSFSDLLKATEQLTNNSNMMLSAISKCEATEFKPEFQPTSQKVNEPMERLVDHLYQEISEYKNCIITMESAYENLLSENHILKEAIESNQSHSDELKQYIDEIKRKDALLVAQQRKNQKLEEQILELLK